MSGDSDKLSKFTIANVASLISAIIGAFLWCLLCAGTEGKWLPIWFMLPAVVGLFVSFWANAEVFPPPDWPEKVQRKFAAFLVRTCVFGFMLAIAGGTIFFIITFIILTIRKI